MGHMPPLIQSAFLCSQLNVRLVHYPKIALSMDMRDPYAQEMGMRSEGIYP